MSKSVKNSGIEKTDRVELSGAFDVYSHGNGFQLNREDRTYSIIPVALEHSLHGVDEIGWEVRNYQENTAEKGTEQFEGLTDAIEHVLQEEGLKVSVYPVGDYYNMLENRGGRP